MADQAGNRAARSNELVQSMPSRQATEAQAQPRGNEIDVRTMIVGPQTSFSGQITSCNRLIVEGAVDAKLDNCQYLITNETGVFEGDVSTENADVHGRFEVDQLDRLAEGVEALDEAPAA
jgi:cytoskeletal protein CcmA (bactofilin family)